jgi:hypothetical protein
MAKNDTILIDGILDERVAKEIPSSRRDEAFEFFAFEQILRDADLSSEEISYGSVDGGGDGGIDGFFILVNGHLLKDPDNFYWPKSGCELDVWIITCKHHDTFKQSPLDSLTASISELFDFSINQGQLNGRYSPAILSARKTLISAYRKLSPKLTRFSINFTYASRGDTNSIGTEVISRSKQIISIATDFFGACNAAFNFWGASELIQQNRETRTFSLELPFSEAFAQGERYIILCRLRDIFTFVVDHSQNLRRYLFDSNVRAFMGLNRVNEDIQSTLLDENSPDFWWLNNGITILANSATLVGKSIQMEGVQIVNGLQTTESIWRYFRNGGTDPKERSVLVKVIISTNSDVRDKIIRATNNQTPVQLQTLHALDKIQRDIEDILHKNGLFYERRTNFYKNQGHPKEQIVTPLYVAAAFINLVLKNPAEARSLKSKKMRNEDFNERVFSENTPIDIWPKITWITLLSDRFLNSVRGDEKGSSEHFLKRWRHTLALIAVSRIFGKFYFTTSDLLKLDLALVSSSFLESTWEQIVTSRDSQHSKDGNELIRKIFQEAKSSFGLDGLEPIKKSSYKQLSVPARQSPPLSEELLKKIDSMLPPQPWKPRIHINIATQLNCTPKFVTDAISALISAGKRNRQTDGVVYAADGTIIARDETRDTK